MVNRKLFLGVSLQCGESPIRIGMHAMSSRLKDVLAALSEGAVKM